MQHATIFSEQLLHAASQAMGVARQQPKQNPQLAQRAALTTRLEEQSSSEAQSSDAGMHPSDPSLDDMPEHKTIAEQRARNQQLRDLIIEGRIVAMDRQPRRRGVSSRCPDGVALCAVS